MEVSVKSGEGQASKWVESATKRDREKPERFEQPSKREGGIAAPIKDFSNPPFGTNHSIVPLRVIYVK